MNMNKEQALKLFEASLGKYKHVVLSKVEFATMWPILEKLKPTEDSSSFHISEAVYSYMDVDYCCLWEMASKSIKPFEISIRTLRKVPVVPNDTIPNKGIIMKSYFVTRVLDGSHYTECKILQNDQYDFVIEYFDWDTRSVQQRHIEQNDIVWR
jgi:hypothetical protein